MTGTKARVLFPGLVALTGLATSCAVTPPGEINAKYREILEARRDQYRIKDGDTVTVRVYNRAGDLSTQQLLVLPDGRSDPFFMPSYRFAGKTIPEVTVATQELLRGQLEPGSELSIQVTPRGETVYLNGELELLRTTTVPLTVGMTLNDLVATGGGVRVTGDSDYVLLRRPFGREPGNPELYRVDLNDLSEEVILLPGDHVLVPRTFLATVVVYVREYVFGIVPSTLWSVPLSSAFAF